MKNRHTVGFCVLSCVLFVTASVLHAQVKVNGNGYTHSRVCGQCHKEIYNGWKNSLHAHSLSDPVFQASFIQARTAIGGKVDELCLRCHAPTTIYTKDYSLTKDISLDGVTCDFCHTIEDVNLKNFDNPFKLDVGPTKRSILKRAESPAHEVAFSQLHSKSELCGACHDYRTDSGALVMGTYTEWKKGPYAKKGVQCQDCHMPVEAAPVAALPGGEKVGTSINTHDLSDSRNVETIRKAVTVSVDSVRRKGKNIIVAIDVTNSGAGHMAPTGMPMRKLLLRVKLRARGRTLQQRELEYKKVLANQFGEILTEDYEALVNGYKIVSDNRLAPGETRRETIKFKNTRHLDMNIQTELEYVYSPMAVQRTQMRVPIHESETPLP